MDQHIKSNYLSIVEKIKLCALKYSRDPETIKLIVVTKGQSVEKINQVIAAGATDLGENYPEETHEKIPAIVGSVRWHMIGHLQSRKIKFLAEDFSTIHSIDRGEIAVKLNGALSTMNKSMAALFEVNLSGEASKSGFPAWDEAEWPQLVDHLAEFQRLSNLHLEGLMTMPPFTEDPESSRQVFNNCRRLLELYKKRTHNTRFDRLSMGTSLDYEVAIQEGATYLRIGQAIMGERNYNKRN
jgi:PLP dependent protein